MLNNFDEYRLKIYHFVQIIQDCINFKQFYPLFITQTYIGITQHFFFHVLKRLYCIDDLYEGILESGCVHFV